MFLEYYTGKEWEEHNRNGSKRIISTVEYCNWNGPEG